MSRAIIVLGMHRSGTSAVAGALQMLGADLGSELLPANEFNKSGHFEHAGVVAIHEMVLKSLGRSWHELRPLPPGWASDPSLAEFRSELGVLLARDFSHAALWAVKDPRLCLLFDLWGGVFEPLGAEPCFVIVARRPQDVASSLSDRDRFPVWKSHLLYLHHMLAAERSTRGRPRLSLTYEGLLEDPIGTLERVIAALDLRGAVAPKSLEASVTQFLSPSLRHHATPVGPQAPSRTPLDSWADECYALFTQGRDEAATAEGADKLSRVFETAQALYLPWVRQTEERLTATEAKNQRELVTSRETIDLLAGQLGASAAALKDAIARRESDLAEMSARRERDLAEMSARRERDLAEVKADQQAAWAEAGRLLAEREALRKTLAGRVLWFLARKQSPPSAPRP